MVRIPRRTQGGQPGNHNALRHGIYAGLFGAKADKILRRAREMDPAQLNEEIALLRTTLTRLGVNEDAATAADADKTKERARVNLELLATLMRTLIRAVAVQHGLNKHQEDGINDSMISLIRTLIPQAGGL